MTILSASITVIESTIADSPRTTKNIQPGFRCSAASVRTDTDGSYDVLGTKAGAPAFYEVSKDFLTVTRKTGAGPAAATDTSAAATATAQLHPRSLRQRDVVPLDAYGAPLSAWPFALSGDARICANEH